MTLARYHLTTTEQIDRYGAYTVRSCTILSDGTYQALIDLAPEDDAEHLESLLDEDETVLSYSVETREPEGRPGRPSTLPGTIGELVRAVGGVQALCDLLGGVAPSTLGRWARGEMGISGPARQLLDQLCRQHGLLTLAERDDMAERLALDDDDRALLVAEGQFRGLDLPGVTDRTLGHSAWVAYLPSVQRAAWASNGAPEWIDAASLEDAVRRVRGVYHYTATIEDYEAGTITVTERCGLYATSGDAVLQADHQLSDSEVEDWLQGLARDEWAVPDRRHYSDLTVTIERA